ncbi:UNVERIFIED_CONTAM: hypothetical protein FKN15_051934 [Acipenser sinensis]
MLVVEMGAALLPLAVEVGAVGSLPLVAKAGAVGNLPLAEEAGAAGSLPLSLGTGAALPRSLGTGVAISLGRWGLVRPSLFIQNGAVHCPMPQLSRRGTIPSHRGTSGGRSFPPPLPRRRQRCLPPALCLAVLSIPAVEIVASPSGVLELAPTSLLSSEDTRSTPSFGQSLNDTAVAIKGKIPCSHLYWNDTGPPCSHLTATASEDNVALRNLQVF